MPALSQAPAPQPLLPIPGQVGDAVSSARECFLHGKGCLDAWEQQDEYAWAAEGPQPPLADRALEHIPGWVGLGSPICTIGLASALCLSRPRLTTAPRLTVGLCPLHSSSWPSSPSSLGRPFSPTSQQLLPSLFPQQLNEEIRPGHFFTSDLLSPSPSHPWRVRRAGDTYNLPWPALVLRAAGVWAQPSPSRDLVLSQPGGGDVWGGSWSSAEHFGIRFLAGWDGGRQAQLPLARHQ